MFIGKLCLNRLSLPESLAQDTRSTASIAHRKHTQAPLTRQRQHQKNSVAGRATECTPCFPLNTSSQKLHSWADHFFLRLAQTVRHFGLMPRTASRVAVHHKDSLLLEALRPTGLSAHMIGLLNHLRLHEYDGLLLNKVRRIHSYGMHFAIGVAFLSKENVVLEVHELGINSLLFGPPKTAHVLEFHKKKIPLFKTLKGSSLIFVPKTWPHEEISSDA